jgi:hypothetical protein
VLVPRLVDVPRRRHPVVGVRREQQEPPVLVDDAPRESAVPTGVPAEPAHVGLAEVERLELPPRVREFGIHAPIVLGCGVCHH